MSVYNFGTCVWRTAAQWHNPIFPTSKHVFSPEVTTAHQFLQTQVPKLCIDLDLSLLYILTLGTYSKFARKNSFLALGVFFLQPCSSAGSRFAASRSRSQKYQRIVSLPQQKFPMKCVVNWIPLRIRVRLRDTLSFFLSFFLGFRRPNLITGLSGWQAPD